MTLGGKVTVCHPSLATHVEFLKKDREAEHRIILLWRDDHWKGG